MLEWSQHLDMTDDISLLVEVSRTHTSGLDIFFFFFFLDWELQRYNESPASLCTAVSQLTELRPEVADWRVA